MDQHTKRLMFSSESSEWGTPKDCYEARNLLYQFELDVCATPANAKHTNYITKEMDTFKTPWTVLESSRYPVEANRAGVTVPARCWMNPVYGNAEHPCKKNKAGEYICKKKRCPKRGFHIDHYEEGIYDFVRLAANRAREGCLVDCLLPGRTDARWWFDFVWDGDRDCPRPGVKVKFVPGRLKFEGAKAGAPFPSILVTFMPGLVS